MSITIKLGNLVKDPVSGFTGIAITRSDMMDGNIQFGLQPKGEADKLSDAQYIDHHLLEVVDVGHADKLPKPGSDMGIEFGDEVCEATSGYKGIAVERVTFMNGCIYFSVQPPADKKTGVRNPPHLIMAVKLEIVTKAKAPIKVVEKAKKEPGARPPGGPTRSARELSIR